ncbi:DUF4153 domain-containing protein [Pseudomonas sp. HK3]
MKPEINSDSVPQTHLILIALLQGFALLLLHQSIEFKFWPFAQPQWLFAFYSLAISVPTMLMLTLSDKVYSIYRWILSYAVIVFILGYYIGSQATPLAHIQFETLLFAFSITMTIATLKSLMYIQSFVSGEPLLYSRLFLFSWRNLLTLGLSLLFTALTWGMLMLWGELFKAIKIDFFYDLFTERWFYYPMLALANGFGIIIFRSQSNIIDTITRIQQALVKFLLIILVFVSIIFLFTLPFTGLSPLWETGGSTLILWMQALMLFFVNAVYQADPDARPYKTWIHRLIYIGIALLPIYSIISFYGLSLRVEQYGWSLSRCWAFMLWSIFAAFSLGYLWSILKLKDKWLHQLSKVNVRLGLIVLTLMLLVNSPLLDFRKITVASQMQRLETGLVSLAEFDYRYLRRSLAKPGYEALQTLKANITESNPEIALKISSLYDDKNEPQNKEAKEAFLRALNGLTPDTPTRLTDEMYNEISNNNWRTQTNLSYHLLRVNLNADEAPEYILIEERPINIAATVYYKESDAWVHRSLNNISTSHLDRDAKENKKNEIMQALKTADYIVVKPAWQNFKIGDQEFHVR